MDFSSFLQAIGAVTQLDTQAAAKSGGCCIVFSETMEVTFEHDANGQKVQLFAPVITTGQWPLELRSRILASVLESHLFGLATDGNYFGFDSQLERIMLFRSIALAPLQAEQAVQAVESFVNQLERWQGELIKSSAALQFANSPAAAPSKPMQMQRV